MFYTCTGWGRRAPGVAEGRSRGSKTTVTFARFCPGEAISRAKMSARRLRPRAAPRGAASSPEPVSDDEDSEVVPGTPVGPAGGVVVGDAGRLPIPKHIIKRIQVCTLIKYADKNASQACEAIGVRNLLGVAGVGFGAADGAPWVDTAALEVCRSAFSRSRCYRDFEESGVAALFEDGRHGTRTKATPRTLAIID